MEQRQNDSLVEALLLMNIINALFLLGENLSRFL
jgi:hypothetical protein